MRPDSKLWIVPFAGGEARELESNLDLMNSWHSFSPSGRWLVFSSKADTPYTEMYLTHLDPAGHASPAIRIEHTKAANRAINLPEFVNIAYDDLEQITVPAVVHYEHFHRGNALAREGKFDEAIAAYTTALQGENTDWRVGDWRIHDSLSKILLQIGQETLAIEHAHKALALNPDDAEMHGNLGYLLASRGETEEALTHLDEVVRLQPQDAQGWYNRGALRMQTGDGEGALEDFDVALRLNPRNADAHVARGMLRHDAGALASSIEDFDAAVALNPNDPRARYFRAIARLESGDREGALRDCEDGLRVAPPNWPNRRALEELRDRAADRR
jgi:tetratricopeptide (TPR) repeat protein